MGRVSVNIQNPGLPDELQLVWEFGDCEFQVKAKYFPMQISHCVQGDHIGQQKDDVLLTFWRILKHFLAFVLILTSYKYLSGILVRSGFTWGFCIDFQ